MENNTNYCMACMNERNGNSICNSCGFDNSLHNCAQHMLRPNSILAGKYLVGKTIGEGGFGITYIGRDLALDLKIAIKEFYPNGFVGRDNTLTTNVLAFEGEQGDFFKKNREKFIDEARRLAKFRNLPGIVAVNDFFLENNTAYIVMEYIDGQTFKTYLTNMGGKLYSEQVFEMMQPVMLSLKEVHESGIIHRDISPDNIMISNSGYVKLIDFGAARDYDDNKGKSLSIMLKPGYSPEEQYRSKGKQGPWTDVYSICATMYKCITGITPDESSDRVHDDEVVPPSSLGIKIDSKKEYILMKGMAVKQENRYQSIGELMNELYVNANTHTAINTVEEPAKSEPVYAEEAINVIDNRNNEQSFVAPKEYPKENKSYSQEPPIVNNNYEKPQKKKPIGAIAAIAGILVAVLIIVFAVIPFMNNGGITDNTAIGYYQNSIDSQGYHTVGLKRDGTAVAVGADNFSQTDVSDWDNLVAISAGGSHTVGLKEDGTVVALGDEESGAHEMGDWNDIKDISTGAVHTIGLKEDGTVVTAGNNGHNKNSVEHWEDIIAISAGAIHNVGLKSDGTVVAQGSNSYTELNVSHWEDIIGIDAGWTFTIGLKNDGTVVATGDNTSGQLTVSTWENIAVVSAGENHTVGLKFDGTVVATGSNEDGQADVSSWSDIVAIAAGTRCTIGLKSDGTIVATGLVNQQDVSSWSNIGLRDDNAVVGDESMVSESTTQEEPLELEIGKNQGTMGKGDRYTVALRTDGTVMGVGNNYDNALNVNAWTDIVAIDSNYAYSGYTMGLRADGTVLTTLPANYNEEEFEHLNVSSWNDIVAISTNYEYTLGLKEDGTVVSTGEESGRIVDSWENVVAVGAGHNHVVGLKEDGTVYASHFHGFIVEVEEVMEWTDIVAIAVGSAHTVGLKEDGTVIRAYGNYLNGDMGSTRDWTDIVVIAAGGRNTYGLKSDGTVVGTGDEENYPPEFQAEVEQLSDIVAIETYSAGENSQALLALKSDGTMQVVGTVDDIEDVSGFSNIGRPSSNMVEESVANDIEETDGSPYANLVGVWEGYASFPGEEPFSEISVEVSEYNDDYAEYFLVFLTDNEDGGVDRGMYRGEFIFDEKSGTYTMFPTEWIEQPEGYVSSGFSDVRIEGDKLFASTPYELELEKS